MCKDITTSFENKRELFSTKKKDPPCADQYSKISSS